MTTHIPRTALVENFSRAIALIDVARHEDAEPYLEAIVSAEPGAHVAAFLLGWCRAKRLDHRGAIEAYDQAIASFESIPDESEYTQRARLCRGLSFAELGEIDRSRADFVAASHGPNRAMSDVLSNMLMRVAPRAQA